MKKIIKNNIKVIFIIISVVWAIVFGVFLPFIDFPKPYLAKINATEKNGQISINGTNLVGDIDIYINGDKLEEENLIYHQWNLVTIQLPEDYMNYSGDVIIQADIKKTSFYHKKTNLLSLTLEAPDYNTTPVLNTQATLQVYPDHRGEYYLFIKGNNLDDCIFKVDEQVCESYKNNEKLYIKIPWEILDNKQEVTIIAQKKYNNDIMFLTSEPVKIQIYGNSILSTEFNNDWFSYADKIIDIGEEPKAIFQTYCTDDYNLFNIPLQIGNKGIYASESNDEFHKYLKFINNNYVSLSLPLSLEEYELLEQTVEILWLDDILQAMQANENIYIILDLVDTPSDDVGYMIRELKQKCDSYHTNIFNHFILKIDTWDKYQTALCLQSFHSVILSFDNTISEDEILNLLDKTNCKIAEFSYIPGENLKKELLDRNCKIILENVLTESLSSNEIVNCRIKSSNVTQMADNKINLIYNFKEKLSKCTDAKEYLQYLRDSDCLILIAAADDISSIPRSGCEEALKQLGIFQNFQNKVRYAYLAVIDNNTLCFEKLEEEAIYYKMNLDNIDLTLKSAGFNDGNYAQILINGTDYSLNSKGLNIVVYNKNINQVIDSVVIDFFPTIPELRRNTSSNIEEGNNYEYFLKYLKTLQNSNYITIFSVNDDASRMNNSEIRKTMQQIGLSDGLSTTFRNSYLAILNNNQTIFEVSSSDKIYYDDFIDDVRISAVSAAFPDTYSSISINGNEYSLNHRGLNIVVYDKQRNRVIDTQYFDLYSNYEHYEK